MSRAACTALVIDDEVMVRQLVRRMLEPAMCRVVEAQDGEAGLRLLTERRDDFDVVLTDLLMPGIDGYDVVEVLAMHYPDLPVACMSGFASHTSVGRQIDIPFIPKPFTQTTLCEAMASLIERSRAARDLAREDGHRAADERATSQDLRRRAFAAQAESMDLVAAAHELRRQRAQDKPTP